ncbi:FAD:protein FMN transferase [Zoogloea sp. LCSB751]|uniref:FAD:protein FMN transferase n=1 Tax=Zoogloea sp. LCSB751 TaxID=1965277 RepID=UPI0009A53A2D|nr:FAD:protein FMN transferase [Zoogloea sp. LCSB751]
MSTCTLRRIRPWLGTYVHIDVTAPNAHCAETALQAAFSEIATIHQAMSFHAPGSEVSHLNREAHLHPVVVSAHTLAVLVASRRFAQQSGGIFDPTIAPTLVQHGLLPCPVAADADGRASWEDIEISTDGQVRFLRPLWIDLGGIAKGYAVDCAIDALQHAGAQNACVNAGGDLRHFSRQGERHPLAIRHPADASLSVPLGHIANQAVASSGNFLLGRRGHQTGASPIVHPHHGVAQSRPRSVTVIANTCCEADALTKIVSLLGQDASPLLARLSASAAIIEAPDTLQASPGFWSALGHDSAEGPPRHA